MCNKVNCGLQFFGKGRRRVSNIMFDTVGGGIERGSGNGRRSFIGRLCEEVRVES